MALSQNQYGLWIDSPATGAGGQKLNLNFNEIGLRSPKVNYTATRPPNENDDFNSGFYPGSKWLDTSVLTLWYCLQSTDASAIWISYATSPDFAAHIDSTEAHGSTSANVSNAIVSRDSGGGFSAEYIDTNELSIGPVNVSVTGSNDITFDGNVTVTNNFNSTNFSGTSSGDNTGDEDLSPYAPLSNPTFTSDIIVSGSATLGGVLRAGPADYIPHSILSDSALALRRYWNGASSYRASAIFHHFYAGTTDMLAFGVSGSSGGLWDDPATEARIQMCILPGGEVGIGTLDPTPGYMLDANGWIKAVHVNATTDYRVNGTPVIGTQQSAIANATNATDVITQLNTLLAACRTHGLIAT